MVLKIRLIFVYLLLTSTVIQAQDLRLIDPRATAETKSLFINLKKLSEKHILFGHQHATGGMVKITGQM